MSRLVDYSKCKKHAQIFVDLENKYHALHDHYTLSNFAIIRQFTLFFLRFRKA